MRAAGIRTLEFNPVNPANINNRDHRTLLVVDGKTAFLGGINISESYSSGSFSRSSKKDTKSEAGWRDTHFAMTAPPPVVAGAGMGDTALENWL